MNGFVEVAVSCGFERSYVTPPRGVFIATEHTRLCPRIPQDAGKDPKGLKAKSAGGHTVGMARTRHRGNDAAASLGDLNDQTLGIR